MQDLLAGTPAWLPLALFRAALVVAAVPFATWVLRCFVRRTGAYDVATASWRRSVWILVGCGVLASMLWTTGSLADEAQRLARQQPPATTDRETAVMLELQRSAGVTFQPSGADGHWLPDLRRPSVEQEVLSSDPATDGRTCALRVDDRRLLELLGDEAWRYPLTTDLSVAEVASVYDLVCDADTVVGHSSLLGVPVQAEVVEHTWSPTRPLIDYGLAIGVSLVLTSVILILQYGVGRGPGSQEEPWLQIVRTPDPPAPPTRGGRPLRRGQVPPRQRDPYVVGLLASMILLAVAAGATYVLAQVQVEYQPRFSLALSADGADALVRHYADQGIDVVLPDDREATDVTFSIWDAQATVAGQLCRGEVISGLALLECSGPRNAPVVWR